MQILFLSNAGGGSSDPIEIPDGTTIEQLFAAQVASDDPQDYVVRVNRQPATTGQVLQPGDRVSFTVTRLEDSA